MDHVLYCKTDSLWEIFCHCQSNPELCTNPWKSLEHHTWWSWWWFNLSSDFPLRLASKFYEETELCGSLSIKDITNYLAPSEHFSRSWNYPPFLCATTQFYSNLALQFQMRFATMDILMWYKALCWQLLILTYCPRDLLPNSVADQTKFKPLPFQATAPLVFCDLPHPIMNV